MKRKLSYCILFLFCGFFISPISLYAAPSDPIVVKAFKFYKSGEYVEVINYLKSKPIPAKHIENVTTKFYLMGLSYSKMQKFDDAIKYYKLVDRKLSQYKNIKKENFLDTYYELGQSYYAMDELKLGVKAFKKSLEFKFKEGASLYYIALLNQELDKLQEAEKYYRKLIKYAKKNKDLKQAGYFQIGEVRYEDAAKYKDAFNPLYQKYVKPPLLKGYLVDKKSSLGKDIKKRKYDIEKKHGLIKKPKPKIFFFRYTLAFDYDTNVTSTPDSSEVVASNISSSIIKNTIFTYFNKKWSKKYSTKFEVRTNFDRYTNRNITEIIQNDNLNIVPAIKSKFKHKWFGGVEQLSFDLDYTYTAKDIVGINSLNYYGNYISAQIGQSFKILNKRSNLKFKYKVFNSWDGTSDSSTTSFSFNITLPIKSLKHSLRISNNVDLGRSTVSESSNTNTVTLRGDYTMPKLLLGMDWAASLSFSFLDPINSRETRGLEVTTTPGINFTKKYTKDTSATIKYDYTSKSSKDAATYSYSKHATGIALNINF
jgi:tetratricopeptide (TPR) repeat protein